MNLLLHPCGNWSTGMLTCASFMVTFKPTSPLEFTSSRKRPQRPRLSSKSVLFSSFPSVVSSFSNSQHFTPRSIYSERVRVWNFRKPSKCHLFSLEVGIFRCVIVDRTMANLRNCSAAMAARKKALFAFRERGTPSGPLGSR